MVLRKEQVDVPQYSPTNGPIDPLRDDGFTSDRGPCQSCLPQFQCFEMKPPVLLEPRGIGLVTRRLCERYRCTSRVYANIPVAEDESADICELRCDPGSPNG